MFNKPLFKVLYTIFISLIVLSFLFTFLAIGKRSVNNAFDDQTILNWSDGWKVQVDLSDPYEVDLPVKLGSEYNASVSVSKRLPESLGNYNSMMIESRRQEVYVYVDGRLRSGYTDEGQRIGKSLPSCYLMVPLYSSDSGKSVRVRLKSDTYYSGNISDIFIGNEMSLILMLIKSNMVWVVLIGVIGIIGLINLVCFFMYKNTFNYSVQFLHLFWFSLFTTIWCFSQSKIRQVFIKDLSVCESIGHCCFMLIPFVILLISNYFSDFKHPKFHQIGIGIAICNFLVQNILHTRFGVDYFQLQTFTQLYTLWILTTCIGSCLIETFRKQIQMQPLIVIGFLGQTIGIIVEAILTGLGVNYIHLSFYIIGSFIFTTAISLNTFFKFREEQKEKKEAENANKAKSMFLATMSHEIRTPINVVLGMNEMILREAPNDTIRDYAINIEESGKSLLSLVNDILDFSKIESGKMEIVCVDYYLKSLLNDLILMTRTRIGKKDLKLELNIDETVPSKLYGDEVRIKETLTNLLTNAVKYTESGTITFSVKGVEKQDTDLLLEFSVKDTGNGMKPKNIETLMSSTFIRFDEQKNRNIEGTGLGIAITRQLLLLMDSELKIDSVYGEGSNFYFVLRQHIVDESPMGPVEQKIVDYSVKKKQTIKVPEANILAVDDTKTNLLVIKGLLKPYEMNVETVASGLDCIEKCKEKHYDIIFMDHMMPGMDGIETLNKLKEDGLIADDTRVIVLTANAILGAEEVYMKEGFDGYLTKPIDVSLLDTCLRNNLKEELIKNNE